MDVKFPHFLSIFYLLKGSIFAKLINMRMNSLYFYFENENIL